MQLISNQAYTFFIFILTGFIIGIIFDIFRVLRKTFKTTDSITYIQDIFFWIVTGVFVLFTIFKFNNGEIRGYVFFGISIGILIYILIFSKVFVKISVDILNMLKEIIIKIGYILIYPFKMLFKIILKPVTFIFINIRKSVRAVWAQFWYHINTFINKNISKSGITKKKRQQRTKKTNKKKDF